MNRNADSFAVESILLRNEPEKNPGQTVSKIVSNFFYLRHNEKVADLVDIFNRNKSVEAVGVVDDTGRVIGIVAQTDLLALVSRAFGRDVFNKKPVSSVISEVRIFEREKNVFTVAEEIDREMKEPGITYFALVNRKGEFQGIFSTKDMLIYLSDMTRQDIALARQLQGRIVRERESIETGCFEFMGASSPAKGVGGDFYAVKNYHGPNWVFAVCDVSGKGVAASIITSVLWGMMSIYDFRLGMKSFVRELNDYLVNTFNAEKFVTGLFVDFDEETGVCSICDMGHSHLYNFRGGRLRRLKTSGANLPMGIMPGIEPELNRFAMESNDVLFLLTDGIIEQTNGEGQAFGIERMARIIGKNGEGPLDSLYESLIADFHAFRGTQHLHDDITFLFLRYLAQRNPAGGAHARQRPVSVTSPV